MATAVALSRQVQSSIRPGFQVDRLGEIQFVNDLSNVEPETVITAEGDSYWKMVRRKFGDARVYLLTNHLLPLPDMAKLRVGQKVQLPRSQDVCEQLNGNPLSVREHESLWDKAQRGEIPSDSRKVSTKSGSPDLIYPFEVLGLGR